MTVPFVPPRPPELVGREHEQAVLRAALDAALAGRGSLVLIGGEAGIGKTTLAEVLLAEATARGAFVLVGRCYDLSDTPPYGPWAEALDSAPVGSDLPLLPAAVLPPERGGEAATSQEAIIRRVRDYLAALAARRPLIVLLDDLHWADSASLDLLRVAARNLANTPLLLLATYRDDEVAQDHPLAMLLPLLVREARATRLDLRPLDRDAIAALIAARYPLDPPDRGRLVAYLAHRTEGNALFLGEVLRTLESEGMLRDGVLGDLEGAAVPSLLRQVITRRAARLAPEARQALLVAAVVGQEVPLAAWAAAGELPMEALLGHAEAALTARLLHETPDGMGMRFAHALIREVLYADTPAPRRQRLHRRIGEALATLPHPDPDAVAYHFRWGGDGREARWLLHSGERAEQACAWLTAAERIERALAIAPRGELADGERAWLFFRLARLRRYDNTRRSLIHLEEGSRLANSLDDHALLAYARYTRGILYWFLGDYERAEIELTVGVDALDRLTPTERERVAHSGIDEEAFNIGTHHATLAAFLAEVGRYAAAQDAAAQALCWVSEYRGGGSSDDALADTHLGLALVHAALGRPDEARMAYARARLAYDSGGNHYLAAMTLTEQLLWVALPYAAENTSARTLLADEAEQSLAAAQTIRSDFPPTLARLPLLCLEGAWGMVRSLSHLDEGAPVGETFINLGLLGALTLAQGDAARGWNLVQLVLPDGPDARPGTAVFTTALALQRVAARLALDADNPSLARAWLDAHDRWIAWSGALLGRAEGALGWAAYHRVTDDRAMARTCADRALAHATDPRQPLALLAARRLLGELDTAEGRHADAQAHLDAALALADACAAPYERALTLLALAELHLAAGQREMTGRELSEAHTLLAALQALPALARCAALAARLRDETTSPPGASAPAHPVATGPAGLTAREVEVLRLIAAGQSNREMAVALSRSERTIERHLENIYRKIDARNRAEATAYALRHNLA